MQLNELDEVIKLLLLLTEEELQQYKRILSALEARRFQKTA